MKIFIEGTEVATEKYIEIESKDGLEIFPHDLFNVSIHDMLVIVLFTNGTIERYFNVSEVHINHENIISTLPKQTAFESNHHGTGTNVDTYKINTMIIEKAEKFYKMF